MSGIFGIYRRDGQPVTCAELQTMSDTLAHRGPDGHDLWHEGPVGLGHRMLWTTPESLHEQLPFSNQAAGLTITADARIDNRDELLPLLGLTDRPAEFVSDSQVILAAYEKWGEECPEHLLGDFAFVIWDTKEQKLFCARDHFGVKPLYYHLTDKQFVFATEEKALFAHPNVPRQINEEKVADFLQGLTENVCDTFYESVVQPPAAHSLSVTGSNTKLLSFWTMDLTNELVLDSDQAYADAFRVVFSEAVRCRLRSAYPIGSFLSGGLDSSSIACTARDILKAEHRPPLHSFSAIFPSLPESLLNEIDERPFINAVIGLGGIEAHRVEADAFGPLYDFEKVLLYQNQPYHPNNSYIWSLYGEAHKNGVRVMMEGTDGDSIVSYGLLYLKELAQEKKWGKLYKETKALAKNYHMPTRHLLWPRVKHHALLPLIPNVIKHTWRRIRRRNKPNTDQNFSQATLNSVIIHTFANRIRLTERVRVAESGHSENYLTEREYHHHRIRNPNLQYATDYLDRDSAAFCCETRYPFLDKRVAEFCLSLPPSQKLSNGWTRVVIRRAMEGIIPLEVQWRCTKSNLGVNPEHGLRTYERAAFDRIIEHEIQQIKEYIDVTELKAAYSRYLNSTPGNRADHNDDWFTVWRAVCLYLWMRFAGLMPETI
jgi:asparagine synthase (glutamine-hydrolysing)